MAETRFKFKKSSGIRDEWIVKIKQLVGNNFEVHESDTGGIFDTIYYFTAQEVNERYYSDPCFTRDYGNENQDDPILQYLKQIGIYQESAGCSISGGRKSRRIKKRRKKRNSKSRRRCRK